MDINEVLAGCASKTGELDLSRGVGIEAFVVPDPNWKEGTVGNTGAEDDKDGLEFGIPTVTLVGIELAGLPDSVILVVEETENGVEDEPGEPLHRLGVVELSKANKAGVVNIDNPEETGLPIGLNRSPAFCVSPALLKLDPSAAIIVACLIPGPVSIDDEKAKLLAVLEPELSAVDVCSFCEASWFSRGVGRLGSGG